MAANSVWWIEMVLATKFCKLGNCKIKFPKQWYLYQHKAVNHSPNYHVHYSFLSRSVYYRVTLKAATLLWRRPCLFFVDFSMFSFFWLLSPIISAYTIEKSVNVFNPISPSKRIHYVRKTNKKAGGSSHQTRCTTTRFELEGTVGPI